MEKTKVLISIILPVYNTQDYLEQCMQSILSQSYNNLEIILVNDGSTDNSPNLCENFASQNKCIKVVHKKNGGLNSARLAGYNVASGEYIYFMDSDDYIDSNLIEKMYNAIEHSGSELAICGFYRVTDIQSAVLPNLPEVIEGKDNIFKYLICSTIGGIKKNNFIDLPTYMWMRLYKKNNITLDCFQSEREYYTEDTLFNLNYLKNCKRVVCINEPLYYYRYNGNSLTTQYRKNKWEMLYNRQQFYNKYFQDYLNDWEIKTRLEYSLYHSVLWGMDNESLFLEYKEYKNRVRLIRENDEVSEVLQKIDISFMSNKEKVWYWIIRLKFYRVFYNLRRKKRLF